MPAGFYGLSKRVNLLGGFVGGLYSIESCDTLRKNI